MTTKGLQELLEHLKTDDSLKKRIFEVADPDARLEKIKDEGYELSPDDLAACKSNLDKVTRGVGNIEGWTCCRGRDWHFA